MASLTRMFLCALPLVLGGCALFRDPPKSNVLTAEEAIDGWQLLWDGETTNGWVGVAAGCSNFTAKGWCLDTNGVLRAESTGADPIRTRADFKDFDFKFEYRLAPGAQASVKCFHVVETNLDLSMEFPLVPLSVPSAAPDDWASMRITARRRFVGNWINGVKQETRSRERVELPGRIVLSPRSGQVEFRNLKIWTFNYGF